MLEYAVERVPMLSDLNVASMSFTAMGVTACFVMSSISGWDSTGASILSVAADGTEC